MKPWLFFLVIVLVLSCFTGCQQLITSQPECGVEVVIEGDSGEGFPKCLVGRWEGSKAGWQIVFEPDGSISSIVHAVGFTEMKPCEPTIVQLKEGGKGIYEPGQWTVQYDYEYRDLAVNIELANYKLEIQKTIAEGNSKDFFAGTVSEDCTEWYAVWTSDPKYIFTTEEYERHELPMNEAMQERGIVVFRKVKEKN